MEAKNTTIFLDNCEAKLKNTFNLIVYEIMNDFLL